MRYPYQCITYVRTQTDDGAGPGVMLLASGGDLLALDLGTRQTIHRWPQRKISSDVGEENLIDDESVQPNKKQKLDSKDTSSRIIKLTVSPDHKHVVTITEDKCVHVLAIGENGTLTDLSQRTMPKRPCAVQVLPDNETILLGDKFGDVYSLPLRFTADFNERSGTAVTATQEEKRAFKPAASHLTVHSKRNRDALAAQMKQQIFTPSSKEPLKSRYELLLAHVSLLTDLVYISHDEDKNRRNYILTADRDEHIRISRAPPQAHIIEGYCLGHTEYISKISPVPGTDLLISGGGDTWLGVWHWPSYKLIRRLDMQAALASIDGSADGTTDVNVSGIWPITVLSEDNTGLNNYIIIACERIPALFVIPADRLDSESGRIYACPLSATPLDLVAIDHVIAVSLDARSDGATRLEAYSLQNLSDGVRLVEDANYSGILKSANTFATQLVPEKGSNLDDFLFGISNLRKRRANEEEENSLVADGEDGENV